MYWPDSADKRGLDNLLSFILHELVFLEYHSQFVSHLYSFALYLYSSKILQQYVLDTVWMHSDTVLSSTGARRMKIV